MQVVAFVEGLVVRQDLQQCQVLSRCLELVALQSCLQFIAFVKVFILGQQPNCWQEVNGGRELETFQSCSQLIAFATEYILGQQLNLQRAVRPGQLGQYILVAEQLGLTVEPLGPATGQRSLARDGRSSPWGSCASPQSKTQPSSWGSSSARGSTVARSPTEAGSSGCCRAACSSSPT